jgi:hypothetical protein
VSLANLSLPLARMARRRASERAAAAMASLGGYFGDGKATRHFEFLRKGKELGSLHKLTSRHDEERG